MAEAILEYRWPLETLLKPFIPNARCDYILIVPSSMATADLSAMRTSNTDDWIGDKSENTSFSLDETILKVTIRMTSLLLQCFCALKKKR